MLISANGGNGSPGAEVRNIADQWDVEIYREATWSTSSHICLTDKEVLIIYRGETLKGTRP
jgi:hypothetical protein